MNLVTRWWCDDENFVIVNRPLPWQVRLHGRSKKWIKKILLFLRKIAREFPEIFLWCGGVCDLFVLLVTFLFIVLDIPRVTQKQIITLITKDLSLSLDFLVADWIRYHLLVYNWSLIKTSYAKFKELWLFWLINLVLM